MCLCYISQQSGQAGVENGAMLTTFIYSDILQNAPFRSQIFLIFFASGGKGALTPLTKILRTFLGLSCVDWRCSGCESAADKRRDQVDRGNAARVVPGGTACRRQIRITYDH